MSEDDDFLIVGAGIIGLSIGISLLESNPKYQVRVVEKEKRISISIPVIDENTQASTGKFLYFWTEKNVEDIPNLVKVLKAAVSKKK
jgi:glycine/D-amino acid oxidase-like deaminating enzyme